MESRKVITDELIWKTAIETQISGIDLWTQWGNRGSSIENIH